MHSIPTSAAYSDTHKIHNLTGYEPGLVRGRGRCIPGSCQFYYLEKQELKELLVAYSTLGNRIPITRTRTRTRTRPLRIVINLRGLLVSLVNQKIATRRYGIVIHRCGTVTLNLQTKTLLASTVFPSLDTTKAFNPTTL
jgi:hypothetical protein